MTDAFGEPLRIGDYVGYVTGGRYQDSLKGRILKFGKTRIKVEVTHYNGFGTKVGDTKWIEPHRATRTLESFKNLDSMKFILVDHYGNEEIL